jgi:hypothetical protein
MSSFKSGVSASLLISENVGAMIKNVRNKASPTSTWFGGIELVASDVLTNESTITIRVKHVIKMRMPGATENTVKSKRRRTDVLIFPAPLELNKSINSFILFRAFLSDF